MYTLAPSNYFDTGDGADYFDSWNEALVEAGFEMNMNHNIQKEDVINDFHNLVDKLGRIPISREFNEWASYSTHVVYNNFGGWNNLIRLAGYEPPHRKNIPDNELLDDIHRLYDKLGRAPASSEITSDSVFSSIAFKRAFGSIKSAIEEAGYEPVTKSSGELHPLWKPETEKEHYYGPNWREQRAKCIGRDGRKCRVCGVTQQEMGREPSIHHICPRSTYKTENYKEMNALDNLIALCPSCHMKFEGKWEDSTPGEFESNAKETIQELI